MKIIDSSIITDKIQSPDDLNRIKQQAGSTGNRVQIKVAMATCSIASGARETMEAFLEKIRKENLKAVVIQTGCMGYCHAEPTVEVYKPGQTPVVFCHVDSRKAEQIVEKYIKLGEMVEGVVPVNYQTINSEKSDSSHKQIRIALRNCGVIDPENIDEYIVRDGYAALDKALGMSQTDAIDILKKSGLRGRGGGGFPTGLKWELTCKNKADQKYVVCNADEGDPGAFMDRSILEGDPHSVVEAMAICGYCIGASKGLVYIRAEYPLAIKRLQIAIEQAREYGLLGEGILGSNFDFDIELRYGAGAFVCGEETALIRSMEGERGEPTVKPPYPAESGYLGKPTNVNNVETFANVPVIYLKGHEWFSGIGTEKSKGTKVFALAGQINNVGLIEVPFGTTIREVVFEIGGGIRDDKKFKAIQTGGPSGGFISEEYLDMPIDYETLIAVGSMMGSGAMVVVDENDCMPALAKFFLEFSVEESCGKCTPCRVGNKRLYELLSKICRGKGTIEDLEYLRNLCNVIKDTALCGLGQASPSPVLSTLDYFYDEHIAHVRDKKCPAGKCAALKQYSILPDKCTGCTACIKVCPSNAITGEKRQPHVIDQDRCIRCGACYDKCKFNAINIQ
jgi:NADH:ubiquinone oxidoreductase subunit F (NADH-binding)/(2Fe-2S) ferredoxin/NAD-dependent dihydropyrimidine dehydrogenase PreA subunit